MINYRTGESLYLDDQFITDNGRAEKKVWLLEQIATITTLDAIEDDKRRKAILAESQKGNHMVSGAIVGGFADSLMGDGDSIIDGVILGAIFGSMVPKEVTPEKALAKIVLLFKDGETLPLEVDKDEYSDLQAIVIEIVSSKNRAPDTKSLLLYERQLIKNKQSHSNTALAAHIVVFLFGIFMVYWGSDNFFSSVGQEMVDKKSGDANLLHFEKLEESMAAIASFLLESIYNIFFALLSIMTLYSYTQRFSNWNETYRLSRNYTLVDEFGNLDVVEDDSYKDERQNT